MWKSTPDERLARWRAFRERLDSLPLESAIEETVDFWRGCPFIPFYLDGIPVEDWPSPWDLITENYFDDIAKCLGIVYTLYLTNHKNSIEFEIHVYREEGTLNTYNLVWLNAGKYVINFIDNEIVNNTSIDKQLKLLHRYTSSELNLEKY